MQLLRKATKIFFFDDFQNVIQTAIVTSVNQPVSHRRNFHAATKGGYLAIMIRWRFQGKTHRRF
ncbi:MAG: hypothetical protein KDE62_14215 [Calditrichaeota bacterium]|nr:hypothetical protein [Calditrichota bacterium]